LIKYPLISNFAWHNNEELDVCFLDATNKTIIITQFELLPRISVGQN